tara:strand:+ start:27248 stop:27625 length:378 start_codon:yes stop_codon:yes gene_type:complete
MSDTNETLKERLRRTPGFSVFTTTTLYHNGIPGPSQGFQSYGVTRELRRAIELLTAVNKTVPLGTISLGIETRGRHDASDFLCQAADTIEYDLDRDLKEQVSEIIKEHRQFCRESALEHFESLNQ